jgi:uncharacterized repeat protein (TIGR04138 family)
MTELPHPIFRVLTKDPRYTIEAYQFVREALNYAHTVMGLGTQTDVKKSEPGRERHLTGQELCEASRRYALEQYGLMARTVLKSWGICCTSDLGEIVYNMISVDLMKKSERDHREDFDDVFDFQDGFERGFRFSTPEEAKRPSSR